MSRGLAWGMMVGMLAGCASLSSGAKGIAAIEGTTPGSTVRGLAVLRGTPEGVRVAVQVHGVAPGRHGIHIHERGGCGNAGNDAGGHFNPDRVRHGFLPADGLRSAHPGDLGNITVEPNGSGSLTVVLPGVALTEGPYRVAGRAIVLHAGEDDFGQPTGNAGGRIGCGQIAVSKAMRALTKPK